LKCSRQAARSLNEVKLLMFFSQQHPLDKRVDAAVQHLIDVADIQIDMEISYFLLACISYG
jgi:hypothetical protein